MNGLMGRHRRELAGLLPLLMLGAGCNLLDWSTDESGFDALMADGRAAIQAGDYPLAEAKFTAAAEMRPESADARYHVAKAAVLNADVDVFSLVQTLMDDTPVDGGGSTRTGASAIFELDEPVANSVYRVNAVVLEALEPIRVGATVGPYSEADVDLDLAVAYTLRGILRLRDTNGDGTIDADDISPEDFGLGAEGGFSLDGIDNISPEDLNDMIDDLNDLFADGGALLMDVLGGSGLDIDELQALIAALGGDLSAYYVNTGVSGNPGTGDNDGDGRVDEECLNRIDDDGDGRIDEDSRIAGC